MFVTKTKLQELLRKKYSSGWSDGFGDGSKKAVREAKKVFVKRIQKEIDQVSSMVDKEFLDGLERAIDLIKKDK